MPGRQLKETGGGPTSGEGLRIVAEPAGEPEIDLAGLRLLSDKGGEGAWPPFTELGRPCLMRLFEAREVVTSPTGTFTIDEFGSGSEYRRPSSIICRWTDVLVVTEGGVALLSSCARFGDEEAIKVSGDPTSFAVRFLFPLPLSSTPAPHAIARFLTDVLSGPCVAREFWVDEEGVLLPEIFCVSGVVE